MSNILHFLRPAIVSMILIAGVQILKTAFFGENIVSFANMDYLMLGIFILAFVLMLKTKIDPIKLMLASGGLYLLIAILIY